jgi:hypothetical protein
MSRPNNIRVGIEEIGMRLPLFLILLAWAGMSEAAQTMKLKAATVAEIHTYLPGTQHLTEHRNGYLYSPKSRIGYQIGDGHVCLRYPGGRTECVKMLSNGRRLQMIDSRGNRHWLN